MTRETRVPAIPDIRDDNVTEVLRAIKNVLQVREGLLGDPLDQNVTLRDLTDLDIVTTGGSTTLTNGVVISVRNPAIDPTGYIPTQDYTTPPGPTGLTATATFTNVYLAWTGAPYRNHGYTEIWRASTNNLGNAVLVGRSDTNLYADAVQEGQTYYYWIRFVSVADVVGPYNSTNGTMVTTGTDPTHLLDLLTGEITESQLYSSLASRIDLIDGPASMSGSVAYRIQEEATTRASADSALSSSISTLGVTVNDNSVAIQTEQTARINSDNQLFGQYTVKIDVNGYVTGFGLANTATNGTPFSSFIVRADSFSIANPAGPGIAPAMPFIVRTTATTINGENVPPGVYIQDAFIANGTITTAMIASLTADKITTGNLTATLNVNTGMIYGGVNPVGWAPGTSYFGTGYLLGSYSGANQFFIGSPTQNLYWNGTNLVVKGTIYASAGWIGNNIIDANGLSSPNYVAGSTGWSVNQNGSVEFNTGTFRGTLNVKSSASGQRMEITNSVIKIFDASGVVRVKLGDLSA